MNVLRFRVVLDTKDDDVFRDIEIGADQTFEELYEVIVKSFDFKGGVMSSFYMSNDNWDKGEEITLLDMSENGQGANTMSKCILNDFMEEEHQRLILVYDFMRMWIFLVELLEETNAPSGSSYPKIVMKFGDSPDEESKELADFSFDDMAIGQVSDMDDDEDLEDEIGDMFDDLGEYDED